MPWERMEVEIIMSNKPNVLNLDTILGKKDLRVAWQGKEYALKTPEELNPEEYMAVMALGEKFSSYKEIKNPAEATQDILESVNQMMGIVAPELVALGLPFEGQILVLAFWKDQQTDPSKKKRAKPR
jgi:hypothetical protein